MLIAGSLLPYFIPLQYNFIFVLILIVIIAIVCVVIKSVWFYFIIGFVLSFHYVVTYEKIKSYIPEDTIINLSGIVTGLITVDTNTGYDSYTHSFTLKITNIESKKVGYYPSLYVTLRSASEDKITIGDCISVVTKISFPREVKNVGYIDLERIAFAQQKIGKGIVLILKEKKPCVSIKSKITSIRQSYYDSIKSLNKPVDSLLLALTTGDTRLLTDEQWDLFNQTGTIHLISISGSHISALGIMSYSLISLLLSMFFIFRQSNIVTFIAIGFSAIIVILYSLISGLSIPTARALLFFGFITASLMLSRNTTLSFLLLLCSICLLIYSPTSFLLVGTWFSIVAFMIIVLIGKHFKSYSLIFKLLGMQVILLVLLFPIALLFFNQYATLSSFSNLFAIPFVEFILMPLAFVNFIYYLITDTNALIIIELFTYTSELFQYLLKQIPINNFTLLAIPNVSIPHVLIMLVLIGNILVSPITIWMSIRICVALILWYAYSNSRILPGYFTITIFDVGQGQSILIETANHQILYDVGDSYFKKSYAELVVHPYSRSRRIKQYSMVIASHGDSDHAFGLGYLTKHALISKIVVADPYTKHTYLHNITDENLSTTCSEINSWQWDKVTFTIFQPLPLIEDRATNNHSCVLLVKGTNLSFLALGDLEIKGEIALMKYYPDLKSTIVLLGHHGSKSSSHASLLKNLKPSLALISSGIKNRYRFPHNDTMRTLAHLKIPFMNSAWCGMIRISVHDLNFSGNCLRFEMFTRWQSDHFQYGGMISKYPMRY